MTKQNVIKWYEGLPDSVRMKLQKDFSAIYDDLGSRETKFYKWLQSFSSLKRKEMEIPTRILNTWRSTEAKKVYIENLGDPIYQKGDYRIFRQSSEVWLYTYKDVAINQLAGLNKELIDCLADGTEYPNKWLFDRAIENRENGLKLTH